MTVKNILNRLCMAFVFVGSLACITFASQDIRFSDTWKFYKGDVTNAQQTTFSDAAWSTVYLPHTPQIEQLFGPSQKTFYLGYCWYRKTFTPDQSFRGKKIFIEFEAAMQTTDVYVNGVLKTTHLGGYTPFVLDITNDIQVGSANVIAVRLDNRYSTNFSPGKDVPDFCYFGGLYRDVSLHLTDSLHVSNALLANVVAGGGVFVTYPAVSTASATVQIKTHIQNEYTSAKTTNVTTTLIAADGSTAGTATSSLSLAAGTSNTFTQTITVANPKLWSPDIPNLYTVVSRVYDNTRLADSMKTTIGIRSIGFSRSGFTINGQHYVFRGTNRHQAYPYIGNAVPVSGQYRDALRMKEYGYDFVRMSHYIQPISFVNACDKLGIMSMACLPGWHYTSTATAFVNSSMADIRTMIRYYRNNPSVIMYEVVHNESGDAAAYCTQANTAAHEEYPGDQMYSCGENGSANINVFTPTAQANGRTSGASTTRPVMLSEYSDWEYGGSTSSSRVLRSQGEASMLFQTKNQMYGLSSDRGLAWLSGDAVWSMFDYETVYGTVPLTSSGSVDLFRIPKFSAYFFRSQRNPAIVVPNLPSGPTVFIASQWTSTSRRDSLRVYSNCDSVSLFFNGSLVATKGHDVNDSIKNLAYPPFSFNVPSFVAGTLRADGKIAGSVVASHTVRTPGTAKAVSVVIDTANLQLAADGSDIALVYASVVDSNGTVLPVAANSISFSLASGDPAELIGNNPMAAQGGIATIFLRTKPTAGLITVTASATGLTSGTATVRSITNGTTSIKPVGAYATKNASAGFILARNGKLLRMSLPRETLGSAATSVIFTLYTVQGRAVQSWTMPGSAIMQVKTNGLTRGMYLGKLIVGNREFVSRILTVLD